MLCSLLLGLLASPLQTPAAPAPASQTLPQEVQGLLLHGSFPPGPIGDLLGDLQTKAGLLASPAKHAQWPAWTDHAAWSTDTPWQLWTDSLRRPKDSAESNSARMQLAELAHSQGRPEDTWAHLQKMPPQDAASLLPSLVAGLMPGAAQAPAIIEPILPPIPVYDVTTWKQLPPLREYRVEGLQVGQTTFTLSVQVPPEGVEVRFIHQSGPKLELRVRIPVPSNRVKRIEYVDWTRVDSEEGVNPIHTITLLPDSEDLVLWARCMPRRLPWPKLAKGTPFPADRNIEFTTTTTDTSLPLLQAMARAFADVLGVEVTVHTGAPAIPASTGRAPLRIDLTPGEFREAKIASLLSQIEANFTQFH